MFIILMLFRQDDVTLGVQNLYGIYVNKIIIVARLVRFTLRYDV